MDPVIRPGPVGSSVLRLQTSHWSHDVWTSVANRVLSVMEHVVSVGREFRVEGGVLEYVRLVGFYGVHRILGGGFLLDRSLLTSLVERWRQ